MNLNDNARQLLERAKFEAFGVNRTESSSGATILDFGIEATGGLQAGLLMAEVCLSGLADVSIASGDSVSRGLPIIQVQTDRPLEACLFSQYAGWKVSIGDYFGMGSGPIRAVAGLEELFDKLHFSETADSAVGVLETAAVPTDDVVAYLAEKCGLAPDCITLLVAPTASIAGTVQVVARSVETAMHKLFEVGFDVRRVRHGFGTAPLPPVAKDDLAGIGRTNDAILYGGRVSLWVDGDDETIEEIGPKVPSNAASCHGRPFLELFKEAGYDFYKIDPMLFSPAEIVIQNVETGNAFRFGATAPEVLSKSFGV